MKAILTTALFCAGRLLAQTPDEARKELRKAYFEGEGHTLVYQLSKKSEPKGPKITMSVDKGRKHSSFHMKTDEGAPLAGIGYYATGKEATGRVIISKEGIYITLNLGEDLQALLNGLRDNGGPAFYFNPQCALSEDSINLRASYSIAEEKPYPWSFLLDEDLEQVEKVEDTLTLVAKNGMRMTFESATGILLEQSYPGPQERKMKLISQENLTEFDPKIHNLPAKPGKSADLENMAKAAFSKCHKLMTMIAGGWLLQVPEEKQGELLTNFQKRLNQHYREIVRSKPYLRDPMGVEVILKNSVKSSMDNMLKKVEAAGQDPIEFLKAERARCVETILQLAPKFAQRLSTSKLYGIEPKQFSPKNRPAIEKILHAQKIAIFRALAAHTLDEYIDERIGQN